MCSLHINEYGGIEQDIEHRVLAVVFPPEWAIGIEHMWDEVIVVLSCVDDHKSSYVFRSIVKLNDGTWIELVKVLLRIVQLCPPRTKRCLWSPIELRIDQKQEESHHHSSLCLLLWIGHDHLFVRSVCLRPQRWTCFFSGQTSLLKILLYSRDVFNPLCP